MKWTKELQDKARREANGLNGKPTPGPWNYEPSTGYVLSEFGEVAKVVGTGNPDDETTPNGRLIAAAPDLLEALRALILAAQRSCVCAYDRGVIDAAWLAIGKAEGE